MYDYLKLLIKLFLVKKVIVKKGILYSVKDNKIIYCPFQNSQNPCGDWCPLFVEGKKLIKINCGGKSILIKEKGGKNVERCKRF